MNTASYVKKYNLGSSKSDKFNREEFVKDFSKDFLEQVEITRVAREKLGLGFDYNIFQQLVKESVVKFNAISNKKGGAPLTEKLFSAFYAITVIPIRAKLFPKEHAEISRHRAQNKLNNQK